jgi:hypothetical protein
MRSSTAPARNTAAELRGEATNDADEFSAAEVLADGSRAWLSQLPAFAGLALLLHAPLLALTFLPDDLGLAVLPVFVAGELAIAGIVEAALAKAVVHYEQGLRPEFVELVHALRAAPAALVLRLRIVAAALARLWMFVVGATGYRCDAFVAVPAMVLEDLSGNRALDESRELTRGARNRMYAICGSVWIVTVIISAAARFPWPSRMADTPLVVVYLVARSLERSWSATLATIAYRRLCDRRDGR